MSSGGRRSKKKEKKNRSCQGSKLESISGTGTAGDRDFAAKEKLRHARVVLLFVARGALATGRRAPVVSRAARGCSSLVRVGVTPRAHSTFPSRDPRARGAKLRASRSAKLTRRAP